MNTKAEMSLRVLMEFVLSGFALLILFGFLFAFFNSGQPPNLTISESNANSFSDFVDFSRENSNGGSCYDLMKISHLTSYQLEEDDENYIYIVTNEGVGVSSLSNQDFFLENTEGLERYYSEFVEFSRPLSLLYDATRDENLAVRLSSLGITGGADDSLKVSENDVKHVVLVPNFDTQSTFNVLVVLGDDRFKSPSLKKLTRTHVDYIDSGTYLVYSHENDAIFFTRHRLSDTFVFGSLCSGDQRGELV